MTTSTVPSLAANFARAPKVVMTPYRGTHYYKVEGHPNPDNKPGLWPSVTAILGAGVPKPALVGWAKRSTLDAVRSVYTESEGLSIDQIIELASKRQDSNEARDYGTAAHALVEQFLATGAEPDTSALGYDSYRAFRDWLRQSGQQVAASEFPVFHDGIAGTVDLLLWDGYGTWTLADIKTGGVYNEAAFQISAYCYATSHMLGISVTRGAVLSLPKAQDKAPWSYHQVTDIGIGLMGYRAAEAMRAALGDKLFQESKGEEA